MKEDILSTIIKMITDITGADAEDIKPGDNLFDDLNMGSDEIASLITELNDTFNLDLTKQAIESTNSIADLADIVNDGVGGL